MNWTFGIISVPENINQTKEIINSIRAQKIPKDKYEIIIIGSLKLSSSDDLSIISFDESVKTKWITRKRI